MSVKNLMGQKFGRLIVVKYAGSNKDRAATWECVCNCGQKTIVRGNHLCRGLIKSCGCLSSEMTSKRMKTHGMTDSRVYNTWEHIIARCNNPKIQNYKRYGGRGITVCKRWLKFINFLKDMGEPPTGYSIDRIDNNKGYCKKNCKWSTRKEQQRNTRNNRLLTFCGQTKCLIEWSEYLNIKYKTLAARLDRFHWSIEKTLSTPVQGCKNDYNN